MTNLWNQIYLIIILLSGISIHLEAQETINWQILEDNDSISVYFAPLSCGDEVILGENINSSVALKLIRRLPEITMVTVFIDVSDGIESHEGNFNFTFESGDESVYDCTRMPHYSPMGPLPYVPGTTVTLVDSYIENH
ncbi:hypothetical protein [Mangrovivirga cuniculi]|nr:hypothetical protein [Mangrovivirga cuniculi]